MGYDYEQGARMLKKILTIGIFGILGCGGANARGFYGYVSLNGGMSYATVKTMHAFMNVEQNAVFRSFIDRHAKYKNTVIHPTEDIDVAMAGYIYDALGRGELVMMAGDRQSPNTPGKIIESKCLGHACALPAGVFRFARACNCPVFAIANMNVWGGKYRVFVQQIDTKNLDKMASEYMGFVEKLILQYPTQWFNFFDFFIA